MTDSALQALTILRDPSQFQWYIIPLLLIVIYIYSVEINKKNWDKVFAGLALWGMDWFNEIWNSLLLHFTQFAPAWGAPSKTAYLILVGLNIEICFMFAIMGIATTLTLPADKKMKIAGIPNRLFFAAICSFLAVLVEYMLNYAGALTWEWAWWSRSVPLLIFLIGYLPFFLVAFWVHDMPKLKHKAIAVSSILGFDLICLIMFGSLGWI